MEYIIYKERMQQFQLHCLIPKQYIFSGGNFVDVFIVPLILALVYTLHFQLYHRILSNIALIIYLSRIGKGIKYCCTADEGYLLEYLKWNCNCWYVREAREHCFYCDWVWLWYCRCPSCTIFSIRDVLFNI